MVSLKIARYLLKLLPWFIIEIAVTNNLVIVSVNSNHIINTLTALKMHTPLKFNYLLDIWVVDYPEQKKRYEINYLLGSTNCKQRIILKSFLLSSKGTSPGVSSVEKLYPSANWLEREIWDMFGIIFYENKDLRRILTDYGFEGYPLRKDFPLSGYLEVRYDDTEKRVLQEPLEIAQEYRSFKFKSPWEN